MKTPKTFHTTFIPNQIGSCRWLLRSSPLPWPLGTAASPPCPAISWTWDTWAWPICENVAMTTSRVEGHPSLHSPWTIPRSRSSSSDSFQTPKKGLGFWWASLPHPTTPNVNRSSHKETVTWTLNIDGALDFEHRWSFKTAHRSVCFYKHHVTLSSLTKKVEKI